MKFEPIQLEDVDWSLINRGDNVFQTLPWLEHLRQSRNLEPVILSIQSDEGLQGYFVGMMAHLFGFHILGSPFRGWNTYFMGFHVCPGASRKRFLQDFPSYAFAELKCDYLEIIDLQIAPDDVNQVDYHLEQLPWFAVDLSPAEDDIFASFTGPCRTAIRKALKSGVTIEETACCSFAEEYDAQCQEVFARKRLKPVYQLEDVQSVIEHLHPTGDLMLLQAKNPEGQCIATQIFLAHNCVGIYWGGASRHEFQHLRPNDLLMWTAIRKLKARGVQQLHLGATAEEFKKKFGAHPPPIYRLRKARNAPLDALFSLFSSIRNETLKNRFLFALSRWSKKA